MKSALILILIAQFFSASDALAARRMSKSCETYLDYLDELGRLVERATHIVNQGGQDAELAEQMWASFRKVSQHKYHDDPSNSSALAATRAISASLELYDPLRSGTGPRVNPAARTEPKRRNKPKFSRQVSRAFPETQLYGDFSATQTGVEQVYIDAFHSDLLMDDKILPQKRTSMVRMQIIVDAKDERFKEISNIVEATADDPDVRYNRTNGAKRAISYTRAELKKAVAQIPEIDVTPGKRKIVAWLFALNNTTYDVGIHVDNEYAEKRNVDGVLHVLQGNARIIGSVHNGDSRYRR